MPNDGYWSNVWMKHPWCASYWSGRPTEDWMFSQGYADDSSWNETFWKNDKFQRAAACRPRRTRREQAPRHVLGDAGHGARRRRFAVVPLFANHVMAHNGKLAHPDKVAGNWNLDGYKLIERWWFA